jgi:hypothetical protein
MRPVFPSACGQHVGANTGACVVPAAAVCLGNGTRRPSSVLSAAGEMRWPAAVARVRAVSQGHSAVSQSANQPARRCGGWVVRSRGPSSPRHRRPRLHHRTHRRGDASAASKQHKAYARAVTAVRLSAQPPADRSVQRLRRRRRWTDPAACWAARPRSCPPSARQRARTVAAPCLTSLPPRGLSRTAPALLRSARATASSRPYTPSRGLCGSLTLLHVSGCAAPAAGPLWPFHSPCQVSQCTAAGLLRQGPASLRAPAGRPPRSRTSGLRINISAPSRAV